MDIKRILRLTLERCPDSWYRTINSQNNELYFIRCEFFRQIAARYNQVVRENYQNKLPSINECMQQIADFLCSNEGYFIENDKVFLVYFFGDIDLLESNRFISTQWFIHEKDELFRSPVLRPSKINGCVAQVVTSFGDVDITKHAWKKFSERVIISKRLRNESCKKKYHFFSKRECLRMLIKKFKGSVKVKRANEIFQLFKYNFVRAEYYTNSGWIFVVENSLLKTTYEKGLIKKAGYTVELNR
jgi:hypothetical protein